MSIKPRGTNNVSDWFLKSLADSSHCACSPKPCPKLKLEAEKKKKNSLPDSTTRTHSLGAKPLSSTQDSHLSFRRFRCGWPRDVSPSVTVPRMERFLENKTRPPCPWPQTEKLLFILIMSVPVSLSPYYGKGQTLTDKWVICKKGPWRIIEGRR